MTLLFCLYIVDVFVHSGWRNFFDLVGCRMVVSSRWTMDTNSGAKRKKDGLDTLVET
jgi:hypothetical protein